MTSFRPLLHAAPLLAVLLAAPALAEQAGNATTIDLAAAAARPAANDLARATVFAEASGTTPGELAKRVNELIAEGLKTASAYRAVKAQSGASHSYPVYAKGGKIEGWRMRSDLDLESTDTAALSDLLGKLQASMGVASLTMLPAPETRSKAESEAIVDAIAAFKARAKVIAEAMGKPYRIKHLTIDSGGRAPARPMMRAAAMASAEAAPMPIEAGDSQVTVGVSGQIELLE
ncbi:SIMPL domain-containing protein [Candidatus Accumulibacter sp. ACC003]|uniref:SIMPL domain-containing protein n=1 Tax=Candidatus Accumulibacter sp. ACC003 TaxID=2823334 RepID=UPI0025C42736|nr:SIMPL domain-containing protein [Candidatus Accumulibacter sp. ACC003]